MFLLRCEMILFISASESNPWGFGVYTLSGQPQKQVGGFSIVAHQQPCGLATSSSVNADTKTT